LVFTASSFKRFQQSDLNKINQLRVRKIGSLLKYAANSGRRAKAPAVRPIALRARKSEADKYTGCPILATSSCRKDGKKNEPRHQGLGDFLRGFMVFAFLH
jgi:hypothetical protein